MSVFDQDGMLIIRDPSLMETRRSTRRTGGFSKKYNGDVHTVLEYLSRFEEGDIVSTHEIRENCQLNAVGGRRQSFILHYTAWKLVEKGLIKIHKQKIELGNTLFHNVNHFTIIRKIRMEDL